MKKLFFLFSAVFVLTACSKDNGGDPNADPGNSGIEIEDGQTSQVVWADDTEGLGGVTFKTQGAWSSSITETTVATSTNAASTKANPDWISISPSSGNSAGTYTINITLGANTSGLTRTATIAINCGDDKITISITQEGKTAEEASRKLVSAIERSGNKGRVTFTFNYDDKGRIATYSIKDHQGNNYTYNASFSYNFEGEVRIKFDTDEDFNWVAYLNQDGYASKVKKRDIYNDTDYQYDITYSNGYLTEEKWIVAYDNTPQVNFYSWKDGNFWKSWYEVEKWSYEEMTNIIVPENLVEYTTYTTIANDKSNIDINMLLQTLGGRNGSCNGQKYGSDTYNRDCLDILSMFGLLGKRSAYMIKEFPKIGEPATPNPKSQTAKSTENFATPTADYTLDSDGYVTKISYSVDFGNNSQYSTTDTYSISYK